MWKELKDEKEFFDCINQKNVPVLIFKHSTRCIISSMAKDRLERGVSALQGRVSTCYLDLLTYRDISNLIEKESGVLHESPQVILFRDKKVIYSASHSGIQAEEILKNVS